MKRTAFARKAPMNRGTSTLARTPFKKKAPKKRAGHDKPVRDTCYGQPCYLLIHCRGAGACVPCHPNELALGKGAGLKAPDIYTVPGCSECHRELDQGMLLSKLEKKVTWRDAYARWAPVRKELFNIDYDPLPNNL